MAEDKKTNNGETTLLKLFFTQTLEMIKTLTGEISSISTELKLLKQEVVTLSTAINSQYLHIQARPCLLENSKEELKALFTEKADKCKACLTKWIIYILVGVLLAAGMLKIFDPGFFGK